MHDALEHEFARPLTTEDLDVPPQHGCGRLARDELGNLSSTCTFRRVRLPVRQHWHAIAQIVDHPLEMQARLKLGPQRQPQRAAEAVANVALALGVDGHVYG